MTDQERIVELGGRVAHLEQDISKLQQRDIDLRTQLSQLANAGAAFAGWLNAEVLRAKEVLEKNKI